jgi:predicted 3-demethylubiquinone-9 3-methyltransferase (glyoxalase superfamily)
MQKITPFLWFDNQAEEAANFYIAAFKDSRIVEVSDSEEEGEVRSVSFELYGQEFVAFNGGPYFTFTPAISFFVNCDTDEELNGTWEKLSQDGTVLMELGEYPFSKKFGWLMDKFGVTWQLNLAGRAQKITPCLMFVGDQHGKAEEAVNLYTSLFGNSNINEIERYSAAEGEMAGTVKQAIFTINGQEFRAMDSGRQHNFTFTPALSLFVNCDNQEEVNELWEQFTKEGEESRCGWLTDKYGVSWQVIPTILMELLYGPDPEKAQRVMEAMLKMKKIDIEDLKLAYGQ